MVGIAQLVRASDCGSEGRGFESHHPPHKKPQPNRLRFFSYIRLLASYIASQLYYLVVILPSAVKGYTGEYNITEALRLQYHFS